MSFVVVVVVVVVVVFRRTNADLSCISEAEHCRVLPSTSDISGIRCFC